MEPGSRDDARSRTTFGRRAVLKAGVGALFMPGLANALARNEGAIRHEGYGPLAAAGPELALPAGFRYRKFGVEGDRMADGRPTPRAHDGMAAFPLPNGNVRLIRNHEDRTPAHRATPIGEPAMAYDRRAPGGTTSLEVRSDGERELVRDFVSLGGTIVNCAGGPTPWGSWLTCEEATSGTAQGWEREHGYVYEVPAAAEVEVPAVPLKALGRFVHEAVAVDPDTTVVYQTEDRDEAGFYRFVPDRPGDLGSGRLQMLSVEGRELADLSRGQRVGEPLRARWIDIGDPDPAGASVNPAAVASQGWQRGAARFSRLEGCWYGRGSVFFHATDGGDAGAGQVWEYRPLDAHDPLGNDGGLLILFFESPGRTLLDGPDNITVSPRGGVLVCEDGWGSNHLRGITPGGRIFDFAENIANGNEFAGACFSPDGATLFVNVQGETRAPEGGLASALREREPGMTFAIWGPWGSGLL